MRRIIPKIICNMARASAPSAQLLVEAPVKILILKGCPSAWSFSALAARASGTTLGDPEAVKPEKPTLSLWLISSAASFGDKIGNPMLFDLW